MGALPGELVPVDRPSEAANTGTHWYPNNSPSSLAIRTRTYVVNGDWCPPRPAPASATSSSHTPRNGIFTTSPHVRIRAMTFWTLPNSYPARPESCPTGGSLWKPRNEPRSLKLSHRSGWRELGSPIASTRRRPNEPMGLGILM